MEKFNFNIVYRKSSLNGNADALSRLPATTSRTVAMTSATPKVTDIHQAQQNDLIFYQLYQVLLESPVRVPWKRYILLGQIVKGSSNVGKLYNISPMIGCKAKKLLDHGSSGRQSRTQLILEGSGCIPLLSKMCPPI